MERRNKEVKKKKGQTTELESGVISMYVGCEKTSWVLRGYDMNR